MYSLPTGLNIKPFVNLIRFCLVVILAIAFELGFARSASNVATTGKLTDQDVAVQHDPASTLKPPASMAELAILDHGSRINGLMYLAAGPGPHPIVIFLHGYPGNERNLDLAQAVRRAGYNVIFVDYRGVFGSGGTFSQANSLQDIAALLVWVRLPETVAKYHLDPTRIALVGHSFGAWLALFSAAHEPPGVCVAAIAAWNAGWVGSRFAEHPQERAEAFAYYRETTDPAGGPIRANPDDLIQEISDHAAAWNYVSQANSLKSHALLLVAATRDTSDESPERHAELAEAISKNGGKLVRVLTFEDDHPFSSHRIALAYALTHWLRTDCARTQGQPTILPQASDQASPSTAGSAAPLVQDAAPPTAVALESGPPSPVHETTSKYGVMPNDYEKTMRKYFLEHLKHPESVQYEEITRPEQGYTTKITGGLLMREKREYGWTVKATINAKDSRNNYVGFKTYTFLFRGEGIVDARLPLPADERN